MKKLELSWHCFICHQEHEGVDNLCGGGSFIVCGEICRPFYEKNKLQSSEPTSEPKKCPICEGRGFVSSDFYNPGTSTTNSTETCRSCFGKGYIVI